MKKIVRSNDEIERIYHEYNNMIYRICFAYMKNVPEAEDMVSDTFVQLIKKAPYFENAEHEKAWLIRVATNLCKHALKHWQTKCVHMDGMEDMSGDEMHIDETMEAIRNLPDKYKTVVYLFYYEGYKSEEIAKILKNYPNTYFHTDATGAIGKINMNYEGIDFLTFAPHKFYGLNGSGVLINFNDIKITPLIHGGKSTTIYRGGTPVTANIIATSIALQEATKKLDDNIKYINSLKNGLINNLKKINGVHINTPSNSIPNIVNFSINNADEIVKKLSDKEIYVSTKTACSSKNAPSKSVLAVTKDLNLAKNSIRVSLSHLTTKEEIDIFLKELTEVINENN